MPVETLPASGLLAGWADHACDVALKHYQAGLANEARELCVRILEREPEHGRTLYLLSLIAVDAGDMTLALGLIDEALRHHDRIYFCHLLRGQILHRLKRYQEAAESLETALRLNPADAGSLTSLAHVRRAQERTEEAIRLYRESLTLRPGHVETLTELGNALRQSRSLEEAIGCYRQVLAADAGSLVAMNNLALTLGESGRPGEAVPLLEDAVSRQPNTPQFRFNLSQAYAQVNRCEEARTHLEAVARQDPNMVEAVIQLASILFSLGQVSEGLQWNRERMEVARRSPEAHSILLLSLHYDPSLTPQALFEEHLHWGRLHAPPCPPRPAVAQREGRIRVGYVSGDFRRHPVGWFMKPVLEAHDADQFEIFCYSGAHRPDELTDHARQHSVWREVAGWSNSKLAAQIREDGIDVLVDLAGFTAGNRLLAFAQRPAPVQVTWLGYPNTTGLQAMDYRLTDAWADPPDRTENLYTERLIRLDSGFLCYGPDPQSPDPAVPHGPVVFGCFNGLPKINDAVLYLWSRILDRVPGSLLFLKTKPFDMEATRKFTLVRLQAAGIHPDRVVLEGFHGGHADHLAAYNRVDVALDTFPYNGTTTTYDALWMGAPVVALEGDAHVGRVCVSILSRAGHPEWIGHTPDEYVDIAVNLAGRPRPAQRPRLLTPEMTEGAAFTRGLEKAYRGLVDEARESGGAAATLQRKVAEKPFWYHRIELPGGIVTPGWAPLSRDSYRVPADLTGKRVLDVGAWDGYWTFLALQRGAREVVAIDDFSDYLGSLKQTDRRAWENFDLCREALGYDETRCRRTEMSVYDVTPERLGRFDVVFFFGTLYHLRHPLLALDRLSSVCDGEIYVESAILDDFSPYRGGLGHGYPGQMVMEFYPDNQYGNNVTNWWAPTLPCLAHMVRAAGFAHAEGWKLSEQPPSLPACRGFVKGTKNA